jgi:hypothetical protein
MSVTKKGKYFPPKNPELKRLKLSKASKGRKLSEEHKEKISKKLRGRKKPKFTLEHRRKLSEIFKGKIPFNKGKKLEVIVGEKRAKEIKTNQSKVMRQVLAQHFPKILESLWHRPTSYEQKIIDLCEENQLPFKYVGDGTLLINYKNPDFIHSNGKKLLIEVYEEYWHPENYEEKRQGYFSKFGYEILFISGKELNEVNWKEICLNKINEFLEE